MLRSITSSCARRSVVSNNRNVASVVFGHESSEAAPMMNCSREFSSSTDAEGQQDVPFSRVYTHPLSQVVLEHLQNAHGDWLRHKGLDQGLTINRGKCMYARVFLLPSSEFSLSHGIHVCSGATMHSEKLHSYVAAQATRIVLAGLAFFHPYLIVPCLLIFSHHWFCACFPLFPVADGSFCIQFPANYPDDDSGRIW